MSWSVSAIGKTAAVKKVIAAQFASAGKCQEPEETVRMASAALIDSALAAQAETQIVEVMASGSMGFADWQSKTNPFNQLSISIQPKHGFVE